jgi:hypothetical protein
MTVDGPLQAFDFGEAGSCQSLGHFVGRPAVGGHNFVVEGGYLVTVEEAQHQHSRRGHGSSEPGEHAVEILWR